MSEPEGSFGGVINWRSGVDVTVSYLTDIFRTESGHEKRTAQREFPRVLTRFSCLSGGYGRAHVRHRAAAALTNFLYLPDPLEKTAAVVAGATSLEGDFDSHRYGRNLRVFLDTGTKSIVGNGWRHSATSIELQEGHGLPVGTRVTVRPAISGYIKGTVSPTMTTSAAEEVTLQTEAVAVQSVAQILIENGPGDWYKNFPLVLWKPNWAGSVNEVWSRNEAVLDLGYSFPTHDMSEKSPVRQASYRICFSGKDEMIEILKIFAYCRGRQGSFYAPTWVDDLLFEQPVYEGQTSFRCVGTGIADLIDGGDSFRNICISSGSEVFLAAITDFSRAEDSTLIEVGTPVPAGFDGTDRASWLLKQRFSADELKLEFLTDEVAQVSVNTVSVIDDFYGISVNGGALTFDGLFVTAGSGRSVDRFDITQFSGENVSINGEFLG